jgi:hypothetical protein
MEGSVAHARTEGSRQGKRGEQNGKPTGCGSDISDKKVHASIIKAWIR